MDMIYFLEKFDILSFWRDCHQFPSVRKVAKWLLSIPASEAYDERTFSSAGQVVTPRRTNINGSTISELVFIHKNVEI